MFSLAAEQRVRAGGICAERKTETRNGWWLDKICTQGVKNSLHLLGWVAHTHTHTVKEVEEMTSHLGNEYEQRRCLRRDVGRSGPDF